MFIRKFTEGGCPAIEVRSGAPSENPLIAYSIGAIERDAVYIGVDHDGSFYGTTLNDETARELGLWLGGAPERVVVRGEAPKEFNTSGLASVEEDFRSVQDENARLFARKNRDYGSKNISESPGGALNGLRVRMWDKLARINNLLDSGSLPENESIRDSFVDLANYAVIGQMVIDGTWPGASPGTGHSRVIPG